MARSIPASEFKAKCLALLDEVAETREPLVVTKRGKAVARVEPVDEPRSLIGSVTYHMTDDEFVNATVWDGWTSDEENL
jgi:prevent-host-death family protein